ncbi:hypothetical protein VE25_07330 [Devosia geojensis]|uniref:Uncharacterized protein n=1 Tax=Devosia geojensis TaxID=443610 RepID=A0A0F5FU09_9HYPH|nr:hypothetical protein [Devosia geojensis]KKB12361.1 hypothetical protein VE25_07330 [Devosia geojensis]
MRVLRGFAAQGVVAVYTEAAGGGDPLDFDAPCNAPAKSPMAHLDKIAFHSDFFQYEIAIGPTRVDLTHPAVPTATVTWQAPPLFVNYPTRLSYTTYGQQVAGAQALLTHGLGYTPLVMVAVNGAIAVGGTIVQESSAGRRFASVYANGSQVGIAWCGYSSTVDLPAIAVSYDVMVFRTPAADPAQPLFSGNPTQFQVGRGKVRSSASYLRRRTASESPFDFDLARTVDLANGGARVTTGGNVRQDPFYTGSYPGGTYVPVGV